VGLWPINLGGIFGPFWWNIWSVRIEKQGKPFVSTAEYVERITKNAKSHTDPLHSDFLKELLLELKELQKGDVSFKASEDGEYCRNSVNNLSISKCFSCNKLSVWRYDRLLFPEHVLEFVPNQDLDEEIKFDFAEAAAIINNSPRGAAALLRLCVQKLCKQVGEKGHNINDDIASLVEKGLNAKVQKALDIVRVTGNNAVHPGQIDLKDNRQTAVKLFELLNIIAEAMITQPKQIDALYDVLPDDAKQAIIKRDAKKNGATKEKPSD